MFELTMTSHMTLCWEPTVPHSPFVILCLSSFKTAIISRTVSVEEKAKKAEDQQQQRKVRQECCHVCLTVALPFNHPP